MAHKNPRALRSDDGCATSAQALADYSWRCRPPVRV